MIRERAERRLVARQRHVDRRHVRIGALPEPEARVRVGAGQPDHAPRRARAASHRASTAVRPIEQRGQRLRRPQRIRQQRARERHEELVAPFAVGVEPLEAVERRVPVAASCSDGRGEPGCAAMPKPPSRCTSSITSSGVPASGYGDGRQAERDVVPAGRCSPRRRRWTARRCDSRRLGRPRAVAVIGQDDELQAGARRRGRDRRRRAAAVRPIGVNVIRAANRRCGRRAPVRRSCRGGSSANRTIATTTTASDATREA